MPTIIYKVFNTSKPVLLRSSLFLSILICIIILGAMPPHRSATVHGQVVLNAGSGWDGNWVGSPSVIYDGSSFTMWYEGMGTIGKFSIGLATSNDGISWSRYSHNPVFNASRGEQWDSKDVQYPWVLYEDGVYKMWYTRDGIAGTAGANQQIGYATSPDGINWTKYSGNPVLSPSPGLWDGFQVNGGRVVHVGSSYVMYYEGEQSQSSSYAIGVATSKDGVHWTKTGKATIQSHGWDKFQVIGGVAYLNGSYVALYAGGNGTTTNSIGIASSVDGVNWTPFTSNPIITPAGPKSWDSFLVESPMLLVVGDHYYVPAFNALASNRMESNR